MNSWEQFKRMYEATIKEQLVPVEMMKPVSPVGCIPRGTMVYYDDIYINPEEQEKEMNAKVFEYCITDFDEEGNHVILVGPELIVIESEAAHENLALVQIGQRHADVVTPESTVLIRPFC